eukprot:scaffold62414_cov75-Phaeocystis_antarctica.AAC.1
MSRGMSAEKRARRMRSLGLAARHTSITSKPMASPSPAQGKARTRFVWDPVCSSGVGGLWSYLWSARLGFEACVAYGRSRARGSGRSSRAPPVVRHTVRGTFGSLRLVRVRRTYSAWSPGGTLPCASGTYSTHEAGTRSPYVLYGGSRAEADGSRLRHQGREAARRDWHAPTVAGVGGRVNAAAPPARGSS